MKKIALINLIAIVFIAVSCTKFGKNITVKGRVLNPITGEGYAGVEIKLLRSKSFQYAGGYTAIQKVTSDENGYYEISAMRTGTIYLIPGEIGDKYSCGFKYNNKYYSMIQVTKGKVMHVDYHIVPYGKLQINIKDINCNGSNDTLKIYRTHSLPNFYDNVPNPAIYVGCIDQTGNMNQAPMGWYKYTGVIIKNGVTTPISDSIFLEKGETKVWNIFY